ncbi:MAG: hypothetical protein K940chlam6_00265 [Chlamydiae bacterium]|nr:hypothetical protein [Chlamydiota bacterium]
MDPDAISFLRDICKKSKEVADLSDRFLALQAAKKKREDFLFLLAKRKSLRIDLYHFLAGMNTMTGHRSTP